LIPAVTFQPSLKQHGGFRAALDGTARELLNEVEQGEGRRSALSVAEAFLRDALRGGAAPGYGLKTAAMANCLAWRTVERAKKSLRIVAVKPGMRDCWIWRLPELALDENSEHRQNCPKTANTNGLAVFEEDGGLRPDEWEGEI
jgi:hypothetical protein